MTRFDSGDFVRLWAGTVLQFYVFSYLLKKGKNVILTSFFDVIIGNMSSLLRNEMPVRPLLVAACIALQHFDN